jgi:hypothetical protein
MLRTVWNAAQPDVANSSLSGRRAKPCRVPGSQQNVAPQHTVDAA